VKQIALESYHNGASVRQPEVDDAAGKAVAQEFRNEKRSSPQAPFKRPYYKRSS